MSFEEDFPSLWGLWERKMWSEDDFDSTTRKTITGEFGLSDLQKHCVDKARLREILSKWLEITDDYALGTTITKRGYKDLLKELGL